MNPAIAKINQGKINVVNFTPDDCKALTNVGLGNLLQKQGGNNNSRQVQRTNINFDLELSD